MIWPHVVGHIIINNARSADSQQWRADNSYIVQYNHDSLIIVKRRPEKYSLQNVVSDGAFLTNDDRLFHALINAPHLPTICYTLRYCRMALRYFCAKLSKIAVSVCTYLWELNTQLILGIYQKWFV